MKYISPHCPESDEMTVAKPIPIMKTSLFCHPVLAVCVGVFLLPVLQLRAAVIAYELFDDYPPGNLNSLNGGFGWGSAWSVGSGSAAVGANGATVTGAQAFRFLSSSLTGGTGSYYISFTIDNLNESGRHLSMTFYNGVNPGSGELFYVGQATGGNYWTILVGGTGNGQANADNSVLSRSTPITDPSQPAVNLVLRIDFNASGNEAVNVWINPDLNAAEPDPLTANLTLNSQNFSQINHIGIRGLAADANHATVSGLFDDIIIATTWADLSNVPEPGRGMLALGGLVFLVLHRRRTGKHSR